MKREGRKKEAERKTRGSNPQTLQNRHVELKENFKGSLPGRRGTNGTGGSLGAQGARRQFSGLADKPKVAWVATPTSGRGVRVNVDPGPGDYATALRAAETKSHT